jgi:hypothetical protein
MNYIKIITDRERNIEATTNAFLKSLAELGHRVVSSRVHFFETEGLGSDRPWVKILFVVSDEAHRRKPK